MRTDHPQACPRRFGGAAGRRTPAGATELLWAVTCLVAFSAGQRVMGNPIPWPPPANMPLEDMHVQIVDMGGDLYAVFAGEFTFTYIPAEVTSMLFPVPPDAMLIEVRQDGAPVPWTWSTERYPTVLPELPTIPMIQWNGPFPVGGCIFSVEYQHFLIRRPNEFIFFYANGTGKYFETYEKTTTAHFDINYPECHSIKSVLWDYLPYAYQLHDYDLTLTVQSMFGPIIHDVIVSLISDLSACDLNANGAPDSQDRLPRVRFAAPTSYDQTADGGKLLLTDVNNDRRPDLVMLCWGPGRVSIGLNGGNGTFSSPAEYPVGQSPREMTAGDFNNDGWTDVAVTDQSSASVGVLLNQGDGTLTPRVDYPSGGGCSKVAHADLDHDGDLDLVTAVIYSSTCTAYVLLNSGNGTFAAPISYTLPSYAYSIACLDVDGDLDPDLIVTSTNKSSSVVVRLNDGSGVFGPPLPAFTGHYCDLLAGDDLDNDGDLDLAVTDGENTVCILRNNGHGQFTLGGRYGVRPQPERLLIADLDGDGRRDVVTAGYDYYPVGDMMPSSGALTLLLNRGDGTFRPGPDLLLPDTSQVHDLATADVDGDTRQDLAAIRSGSSTLASFYLNGTSSAGVPCDFDHDRDVDLADLKRFEACQTGPGIAQTGPDCAGVDLDGDADIDQSDFGFFQQCFSGEDTPADPGCTD